MMAMASATGLFAPLAPLRFRQPHLVLRPASTRWRGPRAMASVSPPPGGNSPPPPQLYPGAYGPWSVDSNDVREVVLYRAGLVTAATTFIAGASTALLPDDIPLKPILQSLYDPLFILGASGLGASLFLIHIYVTPLKRALQILWALGVVGSLGLAVNFAVPVHQGLMEFVLNNRAAIWAVGPLFASLTGLVFKEGKISNDSFLADDVLNAAAGLCYGKVEAAVLFFVIPSLLLGRLFGVMDEQLQVGLLAAWMALFAVFASRKFTQPIKDDIGDKSVFMFNALPKAEQQALLSKLQAQQQQEQQALQKD